MTETAAVPSSEPRRRLRFDWVPAVLFRPRQAFAAIASQSRSVWLTPMLILTLAALILVAVSGPVKQAAAMSGEVQMPPDFQWWTPEQQAQYMQAISATNGPTFIYIFPALMALVKVWFGWLLVSGLLHLLLTMLGGRGEMGIVLNLVAWAGLPFALRDLVRTGSALATDRLVTATGLAGFTPAGEGTGIIFLGALMALIDIYLIWHAVLLVLGVRAANGLKASRAAAAVLITLAIALLLQAGWATLSASLSSLTIIRAF